MKVRWFLVPVTVLIVSFVLYTSNDQLNVFRSLDHANVLSSYPSQQRSVTILLWTKLYGGLGEIPLNDPQWPKWCTLTRNRSFETIADVLAFSGLYNDLSYEERPKTRNAQQPWIVFMLESPGHYVPARQLDKWHFNLTMNYRLDADIPSPYGRVEKLTRAQSYVYPTKEEFDNKKSIVWLSSNCYMDTGRLQIVQALKKHIEIDQFGQCNERQPPCTQEHRYCLFDLAKQYKFYLAFENSRCEYYITEKFFFGLASGMVPVIYGAPPAHYDAVLNKTENAYVSLLDFNNTADAAQHLKELTSNYTAYISHLKWHEHYRVVTDTGYHGFMHLCHLLRDGLLPNKSDARFAEKWTERRGCDMGIPLALN